jgi:hypothetical protein
MELNFVWAYLFPVGYGVRHSDLTVSIYVIHFWASLVDLALAPLVVFVCEVAILVFCYHYMYVAAV